MQCPKCSKEIKNDVLFCGYCGASMTEHNRDAPKSKDPDIKNSVDTNAEDKEMEKAPHKKKNAKKQREPIKNLKTKIYISILVVALILGIVLGFLTARGILDIGSIFNSNQFQWTDFSNASTEETTPETNSKDKEKESDNSYNEQ